jgi:hypothetical protein
MGTIIFEDKEVSDLFKNIIFHSGGKIKNRTDGITFCRGESRG